MADVKQPAAAKPADKKPAPASAKPAEQKPAAKPVPKKPGPFDPVTLVKDINDRLQLVAARYSPCGRFILAGSMVGTVCRWDASTDDFAALEDWTGHGGFVSGLAFGPAGSNRAYTGDSWGRLCAWDYAAKEGQPLWDLPAAHTRWLREVACSPDGKLLATCGYDKAVRFWNAADGKLLAEFTKPEQSAHAWDVLSVAFSPDGKTLATGDLSGVIKLWDVAGRKHLRDLDAKALYAAERLQDVGGARLLRFTPDGKTLIAGGTKPKNSGNVQGEPTLITFDPATGKQLQQYKLGETSNVYVFDVAFHPGGYWIAVTSGNPGSGQLLLLRPEEEKPFFSTNKVPNLYSASLHPDGRRLITAGINPINAGNGAVKKKDTAEYLSNFSPIKVLELPETFGPAA